MNLSVSTDIDARPEDVYAVVSDFANDRRWRARVREMVATPPGPVREGTTVREVVRFAGSTFVTETAVTHLVPEHSVAFAGGGGRAEVRGGRSVAANDRGGAVFRQDLDIRLTNGTRILSPILGILYRRQMRLDGWMLAKLLEEGGASVSARSDPDPALSAPAVLPWPERGPP